MFAFIKRFSLKLTFSAVILSSDFTMAGLKWGLALASSGVWRSLKECSFKWFEPETAAGGGGGGRAPRTPHGRPHERRSSSKFSSDLLHFCRGQWTVPGPQEEEGTQGGGALTAGNPRSNRATRRSPSETQGRVPQKIHDGPQQRGSYSNLSSRLPHLCQALWTVPGPQEEKPTRLQKKSQIRITRLIRILRIFLPRVESPMA